MELGLQHLDGAERVIVRFQCHTFFFLILRPLILFQEPCKTSVCRFTLVMMGLSEDYGRRLIPNIVDQRARSDPQRAVYSIPVSSTDVTRDFKDISARGAVYSVPVSSNDVSRGFTDISACVFANAVNRIAWWLESELGKGSSFQAIGYIGPRMLSLENRQCAQVQLKSSQTTFVTLC